MASIHKRTHRTKAGKTSTYWEVKYFDPDGRRRSKLFRRNIDAERFASTTEADLIRGDWIDPHAAQRLFEDVAKDWLETRIHADTTAAAVASDLEKHILPAFRGRAIGAIRYSEVQAFVSRLSKALAPTTVERIYRWLASIFLMALRDDIIRKTPCACIKLPAKTSGPVAPLLQEEVERLVAALPDPCNTMAVVAAGCGLRQGEVFGLTVPKVNFLRDRSLNVAQQLITGLRDRPPYLALEHDVARWHGPSPGTSRSTPPKRNSVRTPPTTQLANLNGTMEYLVFTEPSGRPYNRRRYGDIWRKGEVGGRPPRHGDLPRPPPLLRRNDDGPPPKPQGDPAVAGPSLNHRDVRHLRPPLARRR